MVLVAVASIAGVWLAFMGGSRSLLAFGFAIGYMSVRPILHVKGLLGGRSSELSMARQHRKSPHRH